MSKILKQLSVVFGAAIFIIVAVIGFTQDLPVIVIIFRGIIAMSVATVVFLAFAYFFQRLLFRFVAEQIMMQKGASAARQGEKRGLADATSPRPVAAVPEAGDDA